MECVHSIRQRDEIATVRLSVLENYQAGRADRYKIGASGILIVF